ncbi:MAG: FAD-dependent oxidoreductase [Terriglobales bacterium]
MENILVIGGVAAGLSAASRARKLAPHAVVAVLERGSQAGYSACGLPYFLAGRVRRLEALRVHPAEWFRERRQLDLRLGEEALEIEPARRRVRVRGSEGERWLGYDRLVLAMGARSRWEPGGGLRNFFAANTWDQVAELEGALQTGEIRRVAVVGGGYIGLETAEALAQRGLQVALVHAHAELLRGFDAELVSELPERLQAAGIELQLSTRVLGLGGTRGGRVLGLETASGTIACDAVVNCGGLRPEARLAAEAGLALGRSSAVAVDERQQTSQPGIYAAGDCAETRHRVTGAAVWVPLGAAANKQGRIAGANAVNAPAARFGGVLATLTVPLAGREYGRTGLTLEQARAAGFEAACEQVEGASRAVYLDAQPVTVRIVYQPSTGRLLGAHFRGAPGTVAGRLDTAAAALSARMTLEEIEQLDLAYSPALAPLYEPLLIAAHNARGSNRD